MTHYDWGNDDFGDYEDKSHKTEDEKCKCECHNPMSNWKQCSMRESHHSQPPQDWEKEFDNRFDAWKAKLIIIFAKDVKSFIRTLLEKTREEEQKLNWTGWKKKHDEVRKETRQALIAELKKEVEGMQIKNKEKWSEDTMASSGWYQSAVKDILILLDTL